MIKNIVSFSDAGIRHCGRPHQAAGLCGVAGPAGDAGAPQLERNAGRSGGSLSCPAGNTAGAEP